MFLQPLAQKKLGLNYNGAHQQHQKNSKTRLYRPDEGTKTLNSFLQRRRYKTKLAKKTFLLTRQSRDKISAQMQARTKSLKNREASNAKKTNCTKN